MDSMNDYMGMGAPDQLPAGYGNGEPMRPETPMDRGQTPALVRMPDGPAYIKEGSSYGAAQGGLPSRDVPDPSGTGWVYRQYKDGSIQIIGVPRGYEKYQYQYVTATDPATSKQWSAITTAIGTWQSFKATQVSNIAQQIVKTGTQVATTALSTKKFQPSPASAPPATPVSTALVPTSAEPESGLPSWTWWAVGGLVLVTAGAFYMSNRKKEA